MSFIPTHYSNRYINQRYNKALYIVQHLPSSSSVQPTKGQKLELYALCKQVSYGDIYTQRPGMFDVVGRAKWDAWKRLQGMSEADAKHKYAETLLQAAKEAYKKPAGRVQAHQIIQSFAMMQPSGDSGDSSSEEEQDTTFQDDSSIGSAEAEERAYLGQIQRSTPIMNRRPLQKSPASSSQSGRMSTITAPTELRRLSISSSNSHTARPVSAASGRSGLDMNTRPNAQQYSRRELYQDNFDDSVNPWVLHPSASRDLSRMYKSPMSTQQPYLSLSSQQQHEQTVLEPATKRALEALQQEIEALNERINGLGKEVIARESKRYVESKRSRDEDDGWKWVFKAAVKHAVMNLMTASVLLVFLHKRKSPVAHAILGVIQRILVKFKLARLLINTVAFYTNK